MTSGRRRFSVALAALVLPVAAGSVHADESDPATTEIWSLHGQLTLVEEFHPSFPSPYRGTNSLDPGNRGGPVSIFSARVHTEF